MRNQNGLAIGAVLLIAAAGALAQGVPTIYGPNQTANAYAGQLQVTPFATELSFPTSMQQYGDGADAGILVGTTNSAGFYTSDQSGKLLLLQDTNRDGKADQSHDLTPVGGLPGSITSVRQAGDLVFVTSLANGTTINVLRKGATATAPMTSIGAISLGFGADQEHGSYALAVRPTPGSAGQHDLFFNLGSEHNDVSASSPVTANTTGGATGLTNTQLQPESIYKTTVTASTSTASFSQPTLIAKGLRNAAGIAVQPGTGDLYFEDNGMDGTAANGHPDDQFGNVSYSLDTLHKISASQIGVTVPDYNFSHDFVENTTPPTVHGNPQTLAAFAPLKQYDESEGANEIALAPKDFPSGLNNGVFIGFHGQFNKTGNPDPSTGSGNEEHAVVYYDSATGTYWHFVDNMNANVTIGHLDGMLSTDNALFMSDIAAGDLFGGGATGAIYEVSTVPEPGLLAMPILYGVGMLAIRRRTKAGICPSSKRC